jgi:uncharacterized membrane protein YidH (DUF202 family)
LKEIRKSAADASIFNEVQLLLAEKRTALATLRSGIAVFALPLSVLSILIATSRMYNVLNVIILLIPLFLLCFGLVILGTYLVISSIFRLRRFDHLIKTIKKEHSILRQFLD